MDTERFKNNGRNILSPFTRFLARRNISPNLLTVFGVILSISSTFFYAKGEFPLAAILLAAGGLFDVLDGDVARREGKVSNRGAYLDSNLDRVSEFVPLFGIMLYYMKNTPFFASLTVILLFGSFMVSYAKARAEGLGIECKVGFADRPFRVLFLIVGSLFGPRVFVAFLVFLIIAVYVTFLRRMAYSVKKL
jgi:CDP-diacylglycerol--glycerol-3-phosphate 3-phosphatidyltransferase